MFQAGGWCSALAQYGGGGGSSATAQLHAQGFKVSTARMASTTVAKNTVISTVPAGGSADVQSRVIADELADKGRRLRDVPMRSRDLVL